jgi:hypothetical protein
VRSAEQAAQTIDAIRIKKIMKLHLGLDTRSTRLGEEVNCQYLNRCDQNQKDNETRFYQRAASELTEREFVRKVFPTV